MPLIDYRCESCGYKFEALVKSLNNPPETCDKCTKGPLIRLYSGKVKIVKPGYMFEGGHNSIIARDLNKKYKKMANSLLKRSGGNPL